MIEPAPPFFAFDDARDLLVFKRLTDIYERLEALDVEDGVYKVFDANGCKLQLATEGVARGRISVNVGRIVAAEVLDATSATHACFANLLREYLASKGFHETLEMSLDDLIARATAKSAQGQ